MKCDEAKPACGRCVRVGVPCPGFQQDLKWSTKYEVLLPDAEADRINGSQRRSKWPGALFWDASFDLATSTNPDSIQDAPGNAGIDFSTAVRDNEDSSNSLGHPTAALEENAGESWAFLPELQLLEGDQLHEGLLNASSPPLFSSILDLFDERALIRRSTDAWIVPRPTSGLMTSSSLLVEFYFKEPAQIYSCYDGQMNPFRTTVAQLWNSSPIISCALQSMAALFLVETFPQFEAQGKKLRKEAIAMLGNEGMNDHSLLALCMLGGTSGWHDPKDLGIPLFNAFKGKIRSISDFSQLGHNVHFFQDAIVYWEMLLSWVSDDFDTSKVPSDPDKRQYFPYGCVPHPWTGIARDTQLVLQEIGKLIRRQRQQAHNRTFATQAQVKQLQRAMEAAAELEGRLMSIAIPHEVGVINTDDRDTPVWHLLSLAEVYRRTGLAQLYHVFPDLLNRRAHSSNTTVHPAALHSFDIAGGVVSMEVQTKWLTQFVIDTLVLLQTIPVGSGTRDFQPFLLVALSSELRLPFAASNASMTHGMPEILSTSSNNRDIFPVAHQLEPSAFAIEVSRMREFIHSRLTSFLHSLPPRPIRVVLNIVKEVWAEMDRKAISTLNRRQSMDDNPALDVYWMDIMIENGWEFVV